MKYLGQASDSDNNSTTTGVIFINLGSPAFPTWLGLRRYLSEFLMDPRVIELPGLLRLMLVKGLIINFRSHKSARIYRSIWTDEGSPLLSNCEKLTDRTANLLGSDYKVCLAMRYGDPGIQQAIERLYQGGVRKLIVIPLYPQYSGSTTGSTFDALSNILSRYRWVPSLSFIDSYYQRERYVKAISASIREHWLSNGKGQKLLMSFHGLPQKLISKGDPYLDQCKTTAFSIAEQLGLSEDQWMLVFQSRFGAEKWLQPYCEQTLKSLPAKGIKSVDIVCPGFSADCLETLYEIEIENREYFLHAGGEQYSYIACLNGHPAHAELMADLVRSAG